MPFETRINTKVEQKRRMICATHRQSDSKTRDRLDLLPGRPSDPVNRESIDQGSHSAGTEFPFGLEQVL